MAWQTVFKREFFGYFRSPVAYVFLSVFIVSVVGLTWFVGRIFDSNDASLRIMFSFLPWVYLFLIPAVGMRLWSEEKRSGTLELLMTMPLSLPQAVLGKFLAGWAFIALALALTLTLPLTVFFLGSPDIGPIFSGYFGALLMGGSYLAICSLASSLSKNQVISFLPWVYLFLIPAVGMRLWSEEKRSGTLELLMTMPLSLPQAVLGKFLAGWAFIALALALTLTLPLTVFFLGSPDIGPIFSGYFGALLMGGSYLAICSLASSLSKNQVISFVVSLIVCLVLVLLGWSLLNNMLISIGLPTFLVDAIANFSFITHYDPMTAGVILIKDVAFFVLLMLLCLALNVVVLQR